MVGAGRDRGSRPLDDRILVTKGGIPADTPSEHQTGVPATLNQLASMLVRFFAFQDFKDQIGTELEHRPRGAVARVS
jgi:hypothetical protein